MLNASGFGVLCVHAFPAVQGLRFRVQGLGFRVQGLRASFHLIFSKENAVNFCCQKCPLRASGGHLFNWRVRKHLPHLHAIRVQGLGFRVQGLGIESIDKQENSKSQLLSDSMLPRLNKSTSANCSTQRVQGLGFRVQGLGFTGTAVFGIPSKEIFLGQSARRASCEMTVICGQGLGFACSCFSLLSSAGMQCIYTKPTRGELMCKHHSQVALSLGSKPKKFVITFNPSELKTNTNPKP